MHTVNSEADEVVAFKVLKNPIESSVRGFENNKQHKTQICVVCCHLVATHCTRRRVHCQQLLQFHVYCDTE